MVEFYIEHGSCGSSVCARATFDVLRDSNRSVLRSLRSLPSSNISSPYPVVLYRVSVIISVLIYFPLAIRPNTSLSS